MIPLYTPAQVRSMDERAIADGTPSLALMERAAGHLARAVVAMAPRRYGLTVLVLCGKGNNAGDGIAATRRLWAYGVSARIHLVEGEAGLSDDAATQLARYRAEGGRESPTIDFTGVDVAVDCLLGTGASGPAREPIAGTIRRLNAWRADTTDGTVVACDIPSGVDADAGQVPGEAVRADATVVLGAGKRGLWLWPARGHCGQLVVADIGITSNPPDPEAGVLEGADAAAALHPADPNVDKRGRGVVVLLAGSEGMAGAAIMAARGAMAMGTGLLTVATSAAVRDAVAPAVPEAMTLGLPDEDPDAAFAAVVDRLEGADVLAMGPGLGHSQSTAELVRRLVREVALPVVLDADGLNAFRGNGDALSDRAGSELVCTPHACEFARMLGRKVDEVWPDRINTGAAAARRWNATVVLKGPGTIVTAPRRHSLINTTGSAALATGGTGDVLTGMLAAALPAGRGPNVVAATVHVHGLAGELAARRLSARSVSALDVAAAVPAVLQTLEQTWT